MAVPNFGLVVLVGGMVLDESGWISLATEISRVT